MKGRITKMKLSELVLDFTLYPRHRVDSEHVARLAEAIRAGEELPPIVTDANSKRVVDGFHRHSAYGRVNGPDSVVEVELKRYASEAEMYLDAATLNARHGLKLNPYDFARCLQRGQELKITPKTMQTALGITADKFANLLARKFARVDGELTPIKRTMEHLAGMDLTHVQRDGIRPSGGMNPLFYVRQVLSMLEHDLIDTDNEKLMAGLEELQAKLVAFLRAAKAKV